ncbi:hypothetical protein [Psychrobacillus vulpis]|uniref:Uncharacterized protein n=1 Tax=Psychrobacillus vulpis TaxID=2325572 RepID=A0A544TQJ6_9BACI|nr:hypothetical protein [Psychrobacillus vulpis]TQR19712.1 hypothetical protein FG384_10865 [Psychrobacillus vulpis]
MSSKSCAYCRRFSKDIKIIEVPESYADTTKQYIYVCPSCIKEHALENTPEFVPSDLRLFLDSQYKSFTFSLLTNDDGNEYLMLNNNFTTLPPKDLEFIAYELLKTSKLDGLDEYIKTSNKLALMSTSFQNDPEENGKFLLPLDEIGISRKKFNPDKV